MNKIQKTLALTAIGGVALLGTTAGASTIIGGDAADLASADSVLDIVFAIDTSGSMSDDIAAIGSVATSVITGLECPKGDIYVRARFMGITGTSGIFNERVNTYVTGLGETPVSNHSEDNGPAVTDLATHYQWFDGLAVAPGQKKVKAVVTIGDEGTENGQPVNTADYDAALVANSTAIANDVLLFSWVADDPYAGVETLFELMAEGGTGSGAYAGYSFADTGGIYVKMGSGDSAALSAKLAEILCIAGGGGTKPPSVPDGGASLGLLGLGLAGVLAARRRQ